MSLAFVPARPTLALLSGCQEMIAGAQMEAGQQELLSPGKWQAQGWSFPAGMTSRGLVCFQEVQTLLDTPWPALGKAWAGFTALLVGSGSEERGSREG